VRVDKAVVLLLGLLFFPAIMSAQKYSCSGTVYDKQTKQALAFVNIVANNSKLGTASDIDGKFTIISSEKIESLKLTYVGYAPQTFYLEGEQKNLEIFLDKTSFELEEFVVVAGENPAHRIIRNVIENRELNDPEKLRSFSYTSYDKMIFTIDTLPQRDSLRSSTDSSEIRLREFIEDKDFFMLETVSERKFMAPDRNHEKVVASKISGFKDPVFLFLSSQLQSSSFYKEIINIAGNSYINPISKGSTRKYYFQMEDTTYTSGIDSVFIISYRPRMNTNFDGLNGVLSINTNHWAIQNVIAEPSRNEDGMTIRIQQKYEFIEDTLWFPVQLNTDIIFNNVKINNLAPVGKGKSYIRDIVLNPELVKRQFSQISIEVDPNAGDRAEGYWLDYRGDSLSQRERRTYQYIDSIGKANNFDQKAGTIKALLSNRLPLGYFDIDLTKIVRYTSYEGFYLGLGIITSKKFSQKVDLGGYWGYGFKDKRSKYGGNFGLIINKYRELKLQFGYFNDVTETGGVKFWDDNNTLLNPDNFRNFLINRMDRTERIMAALSFRALRWSVINIGLNIDHKEATNEYAFEQVNTGDSQSSYSNDFKFTEVMAGFRLAIKEKYLQMPDDRISLGTIYPILWFNYSRGINGFLNGEYNYNKFDLKIKQTFNLKYLGKSNFDVRAGLVDKPIPYSNLYNGRGAYRKFISLTPGSFGTQRMNEFLSDRYIYLFYTHSFGKLLLRGNRFSPEFALATNIGFGWLKHPEYHKNIIFNIMDQGYFESGIQINNLLNFFGFYTLGAAVYYRYGYYHLPKTSDNLSYKVTFLVPF
jgi:hypothetical protein